MAYERCIACGSARVTPKGPVSAERDLKAHFKLKNPPKGFMASGTQSVYIGSVCICADCGFAALFTSEKLDPSAFLPE